MHVESTNPADGRSVATYPLHSSEEIDRILHQADQAFAGWRERAMSERAEYMRAAAAELKKAAGSLAELMATEMGKPVPQARSEVEKCEWVCRYYADNAESHLSPVTVGTDARISFVTFQPLGVILAIMPWNFPLWQVFRFAAPTLMAGNTAILKHASNVTGCALAIEKIFRQASFPDNVFRTVIANTDTINEVIRDDRIRAVSLTGSPGAGKVVAASAGGCLKKSVLELGGSDPYLILDDAEVEAAADACVTSRLINTGQSCIAAKRFIAVDDVRREFTAAFTDLMRTKKYGDPLEEASDLGPLARTDLRDGLHRQVRDSIDSGATCMIGGEIPDGPGAFYPPTVLTDVRPGMRAWSEELFGPVAVKSVYVA